MDKKQFLAQTTKEDFYDLYISVDKYATKLEKGICVGMVCPAGCDIESVGLPGDVELFVYPAFDLPFAGHWNRKVLGDKLAGFKADIIHCLCIKVV